MAWMPGDDEAAAAVEGMEAVYGRASDTGLQITPDVSRADGLDRVYLSRADGDLVRVVVLQRVGGDGTESSSRIWEVADALCIWISGDRGPIRSASPLLTSTLDVISGRAEMWCRRGVWQ